MARLEIRLLGVFQAILDGVPVAHFETHKTCALLAYLAVEAKQPHQREILAEMLWPDRPEGAARANLRHTLRELRTLLGESSPSDQSSTAPPFLLARRETIQINPAADLWVDTTTFHHLISDSIATSQLPLERLEEAVRMVRGSFLEGLSVGDSTVFQEWVLLKREQFQSQILKVLSQLVHCYEIIKDNERALEYARRQVAFAPWDETAHRQVMYLLGLTGQPGAALDYYETIQQVLAEELGVGPGVETKQLYEQIRSGNLKTRAALPTLSRIQIASHLPGFLNEETASPEPPVFVAREGELAKLDNLLRDTLNGQTRLAFITGDAGQGKTALLNEFARRVIHSFPETLVVNGNCNLCAGAGDPYLPFRDVMEMLTGDVGNRWQAGLIGREHARRLWEAQTLAIQALIEGGSSLIDTILSGEVLLLRTAIAAPDRVDWLERLEELTRQGRAKDTDLEQSHLFEQYTNVLRFLASRHPLVLLLDDMQWADSSSIYLLFHLGRRLTNSRVLILCAYRPEEVTSRPAGEHYPLAKVLLEFKRMFGDVWIDLNQGEQAEGRKFLDALLDVEPNHLTQSFRNSLFRRTGGHPLFAIELLRSLQDRQNLRKDENGCWIETPALDWDLLPARVEAVIEERIGQLDNELQQILSVACVEGEIFTTQVVAEVQKVGIGLLQNLFSQQLERKYRLIQEQEAVQTESGWIFHYKFSHVLYRDFLYKRLNQGEKHWLHGEVAVALEKVFKGRLEGMEVKLANHFYQAEKFERAQNYFCLAAERAARLYANDEAINLYSHAIDMTAKAPPDDGVLAGLYHARGQAWETSGDFERSRTDYEMALQLTQTADPNRLEWQALIDLGKLWSSRYYQRSLDYYDQALTLARRINDPTILAESLNGMGNWYINAENPKKAIEYHQDAFSIMKTLDDPRGLAYTLDMLGIASLLMGDCRGSKAYYDQAIALFRELNDHPGLASSLTGRGNIGGAAYYSLGIVTTIKPWAAQRDFEEAIQLCRETGSLAGEAWVLWSLGYLFIVKGDFEHALGTVLDGLRIASEIKHLEWVVGNQTTLGVVYHELFALTDACQQLEQALVLARELRSQHWIYMITGSLTATHHLLGDIQQAQSILDTVIAPQTPMDTSSKRFCWVRRAELALSQGDPALALEITERLIASAPGMATGSVITYLWKLKGEALAACGHTNTAVSWLSKAMEHSKATGERFLQWRIHASLGHLYQTLGNRSCAQDEYSAAKGLIEELAATIPDEGLKGSFLQGARRVLKNNPW